MPGQRLALGWGVRGVGGAGSQHQLLCGSLQPPCPAHQSGAAVEQGSPRAPPSPPMGWNRRGLICLCQRRRAGDTALLERGRAKPLRAPGSHASPSSSHCPRHLARPQGRRVGINVHAKSTPGSCRHMPGTDPMLLTPPPRGSSHMLGGWGGAGAIAAPRMGAAAYTQEGRLSLGGRVLSAMGPPGPGLPQVGGLHPPPAAGPVLSPPQPADAPSWMCPASHGLAPPGVRGRLQSRTWGHLSCSTDSPPPARPSPAQSNWTGGGGGSSSPPVPTPGLSDAGARPGADSRGLTSSFSS